MWEEEPGRPQPPRPDVPARTVTPFPGGEHATWGPIEAVIVGVVGYLVGGVVGALIANPADPNNLTGVQFAIIGLMTDLGLLGGVVLWLRARHRSAIPAVRFDPTRPLDAVAGFLWGLAIYALVVFGVGSAVVWFVRSILGYEPSQPQQLPTNIHGAGLVLTGFLLLVTAPAAEELFFRGFLFRSLRERFRFWPAALLSAIPFGLVHWQQAPWQDNLILVVPLAVVGVCLAALYERRGNLLANIAGHAAFNLVGFVIILSGHA
jgi:membrane protease YdiL (CAAX protease family)